MVAFTRDEVFLSVLTHGMSTCGNLADLPVRSAVGHHKVLLYRMVVVTMEPPPDVDYQNVLKEIQTMVTETPAALPSAKSTMSPYVFTVSTWKHGVACQSL